MTKSEVLTVFANASRPLQPDEVRYLLHTRLDRRSMYSYLLRLARQGLLKRAHPEWGRLSYALTPRGHARLEYFRAKVVPPDRTRPRFPWER
jgi:DNA-binding PadR family transcriptional regulator